VVPEDEGLQIPPLQLFFFQKWFFKQCVRVRAPSPTNNSVPYSVECQVEHPYLVRQRADRLNAAGEPVVDSHGTALSYSADS
jgi:hypothetical protein